MGFCDHTAGGFYTTLKRASFWNDAGYSVHFGISLKGEICQLVNIFDRAYGQGKDSRGLPVGPTSPNISWLPFPRMNFLNPNEYLISIEHEDCIIVDGKTVFLPSVWTAEMEAADLRLKRWCIDEVKRVKDLDLMRWEIDSLAGHHMFDPAGRANCPGTLWKNEYRARIYASLMQQPGGFDMYNIKDSPAPFFTGLKFNGPQRINASIDFGWPSETKLGRFQIFVEKGYFEVYNGDGSHAKTCGWGTVNENEAFNDVVEVVPDKNGWIELRGSGDINSARGLGYWS